MKIKESQVNATAAASRDYDKMTRDQLIEYVRILERRIDNGMGVLENLSQQAEQTLNGLSTLRTIARTVAIRLRTAEQELEGALPLSLPTAARANHNSQPQRTVAAPPAQVDPQTIPIQPPPVPKYHQP